MKIRGDDDAQADRHAAMRAGSLENEQPGTQAATRGHASSQAAAGTQPHKQAGKEAGRQAIETSQNPGKTLAKSWHIPARDLRES